MGAPRRRRRQLLRPPLHHHAGEEGEGRRAQGRAEVGRRGAARHRPRPRGRGHRLAPARHAQAQGARPPDGVPRDLRARHPRGRGEPARPRPRPRRRPGDPPHPRPPLRLRGLAGAVEEGHAEAVGGPGPVRGHADHRAARAGADGVRLRGLLGHRRRARRGRRGRAAAVPGAARGRRRHAGRDRPRLRPRRQAQGLGEGPRRGVGATARGGPRRPRPGRRVGRVEAVHAQALRAVHDVHAAAGGRAQAALLRRPHDARRAAALRERLHHLPAHRLHHAVAVGHRRRPGAGPRAVRRRLRARAAAAVHPQGQERAGGPRGHPARRGAVPHARRGGARARRRRLPPLRAHLAAHGGLADGRRARHHRQRADRRHGGHRRGRHVRRLGAHDHVPRLPQGLRRDPRRGQRRPRPTTPSPASRR